MSLLTRFSAGVGYRNFDRTKWERKWPCIIMIARATGKIAAVTARLPAAGNKPRRVRPGLKLCVSQSLAILPQGGAAGKSP